MFEMCAQFVQHMQEARFFKTETRSQVNYQKLQTQEVTNHFS
jgi:hypothetical protein